MRHRIKQVNLNYRAKTSWIKYTRAKSPSNELSFVLRECMLWWYAHQLILNIDRLKDFSTKRQHSQKWIIISSNQHSWCALFCFVLFFFYPSSFYYAFKPISNYYWKYLFGFWNANDEISKKRSNYMVWVVIIKMICCKKPLSRSLSLHASNKCKSLIVL